MPGIVGPARRPIGSMQHRTRQLHIDLDGITPALGEGSTDASLVDNGVGDYSLTFDEAYLRAPLVVGSSLTADTIIQVANITAAGCDILCFAASDGVTPQDAQVHLCITGWDSEDKI